MTRPMRNGDRYQLARLEANRSQKAALEFFAHIAEKPLRPMGSAAPKPPAPDQNSRT